MPTSTYIALANTTLTGTASSITFSSIPATYRDLVLVCQTKLVAGPAQDAAIRFNGDTGSNYSVVIMSGTGSTTVSTALGPRDDILLDFYGSVTTDFSNSAIVNIMDYSATDKHKTVLSRSNRASSGVDAIAGRWANTNAITSIAYRVDGRTLDVGTTLALYGIIS